MNNKDNKWLFEIHPFVLFVVLTKLILLLSIVFLLQTFDFSFDRRRQNLLNVFNYNINYIKNVDTNIATDSVGQNGFEKRLPNAIIIGVKKGGTRALLEYLRLHPFIRAPGPEIHYFDKHFHYGSEWYRNQMVKTLPGRITLEKTPSYFVTKDAPYRIHAINPNMKLIVVVRNPVTRAISDYTQNVSKRPGMPSFEEMAFTNYSTSSHSSVDGNSMSVNTSWGAIKIGLYHKHIKRWLKYFPREQIHFVDGERLITHPAAETNLVENFLNLNIFIKDKHFHINSTTKFPCIVRRTDDNDVRPPRCLGKTKGRRHPNVSEFHLDKLRDFYRSHNEKFFFLIGQKFNW